ncbi:phage tail tape measure protein [Rhizobiaceae bacterium BDR2-2]|uniref:Phage tail tape measure protein n=1 Tax=Ectorhizobium quercum TaxID=2965071 RepID=A0AAE3N2G3_9HYPH|nr:phage tail tape measure protein [Ectorhizobium quercum]MCX8998459.1 phage tail tape measure protein [Ectorhizobium quercum]
MADDDFLTADGGASALADTLAGLEARSRAFGSALTAALRGATVDGKGLEGVLQTLGNRLSSIALSAGLKPLETLVSNGVAQAVSGIGSLTAFAAGGVPGRVVPFADGGVVAAPAYFPMGGDMGLMGEAGAEAILPLKRGADGTLGVAAGAGGGGTQIVFNVTASDAASFRKSEGQIAAMLARTAGRGRRQL